MNTKPENSLSSGLLCALVKDQQLSLEVAKLTEESARLKGLTVHEWMLRQNTLNATLAARLTAEMYNTPLLDLDALSPASVTPLSADQIDQIQRLGTLPLHVRADRLAIAMADPCDLMRLQQIGRISGLKPFAVVVEADKLLRRLRLAPPLQAVELSDSAPALEIAPADPAAATRFLQKYLLQALADGAAELHLEPQGVNYRLRSRSAQGMKILAELPNAAAENISDMLENQPGFELNTNTGEAVLFDVLSLQSQHGTRRVFRRSVSLAQVPRLENLGLSNTHVDAARAFLAKEQGRICAVSANNADQIRTLYALTGALDAKSLNVFSLESPIAGALTGCTQITMQSFNLQDNEALLDSCLQQSPDVLMINAPEKYLSDLGFKKAMAWACLPGHCLLIGVSNALQSHYPDQAHQLKLHISVLGHAPVAELIIRAGSHD
jgi:type IV pilus assembly protein PilB